MILSIVSLWHSIYVMSDRLTTAVIRAIKGAPCSVNAVATAARVPQSTLSRILSGERAATPTVARAVAKTLEQWGRACTKEAARIRAVTKEMRS